MRIPFVNNHSCIGPVFSRYTKKAPWTFSKAPLLFMLCTINLFYLIVNTVFKLFLTSFNKPFLHRVAVIKAGSAQRQVSCHFFKVLQLHISQRIRSNAVADLLYGVLICYELGVIRHIGSIVTGV